VSKVYIVMDGDYRIKAVFSTEERARKYADAYRELWGFEAEIEEMELDAEATT
jgi:hypothetical protein